MQKRVMPLGRKNKVNLIKKLRGIKKNKSVDGNIVINQLLNAKNKNFLSSFPVEFLKQPASQHKGTFKCMVYLGNCPKSVKYN